MPWDFFLQIGTLPYLTKRLGADTTTFGHLQTVFAIAQLIGGPIYGRIGDMAGEKSALLVSLFAGGLSYLIMGMANKLLLLSRSGFSFGMGMAIGPPLGGYVVKYLGDQNCALLAGIGSFISLGLVYFFVPDIPKVHKKKENIFNFKKIIKPLLVSKSCLLLVIKLLCGLPLGIFQSMFSMIAIDKFGLEVEKTGLLFLCWCYHSIYARLWNSRDWKCPFGEIPYEVHTSHPGILFLYFYWNQ
ncbi:SLC22A18 [Lepeophtheirus salmonis]|uniref:SLC22A18 n=1 Tax=Lepeophtheirus salmonis TaxID=72036 RepID=A0A7R8H9L8_LEPSM|nr:SLC22A18 [Lepeophtheirus salmonis]CAF2960983.1 SLC22A18 [Lepeophtheirus salmonis]